MRCRISGHAGAGLTRLRSLPRNSVNAAATHNAGSPVSAASPRWHPSGSRLLTLAPAAKRDSELVRRVELAVDRNLRGALRAALLHEPRDLRLGIEELLECVRAGPLVDHEYFVVAG